MSNLMMIRLIGTTMLLAVTLHASAFEELGKIKLEPMAKPALPKVGYVTHWVRDGKDFESTVTAIDGEVYTAENSMGCRFTELAWSFAPNPSWNNCNKSTGTQEILKTKGTPWPLKVKNKFSYRYRGKTEPGSRWVGSFKGQRSCKVKAAVRVKVVAGEFDTYKIVCKDENSSRTWWVSPELGEEVAWQRNHFKDNSRDTFMELVKVVTP